MTLGQGFLGAFALFTIYVFARMAWTGRFDYGRDKVLYRWQAPITFWVIWALGVALFSLAFSCWFGLAQCYR